MDLYQLARAARAHPGLRAKLALAEVAAALGGDGDDAAVVDGGLVCCAEAVLPAFAGRDPRVAGIAAVVTCLNDLAASGARPVALLDTVVAPTREVARAALDGLRAAADRYRVPVVGGHTTIALGPLQISGFALGRAARPLRAATARPGDAVLLAACLDGELVEGPDGTAMFSHLRGSRADHAAADLALLAGTAEAGEARAARDVSMPGLVGSLLQFLEAAGGLGARLDPAAVPVPPGVALERWLAAFPTYAFLLVGDPERLAVRFGAAGLACAEIARLDDSGRLVLASGGEEAEVWDLRREPLTGLGPAAARAGGQPPSAQR